MLSEACIESSRTADAGLDDAEYIYTGCAVRKKGKGSRGKMRASRWELHSPDQNKVAHELTVETMALANFEGTGTRFLKRTPSAWAYSKQQEQ